MNLKDLLLAVMYAFGGRAPSKLHVKLAMYMYLKHKEMENIKGGKSKQR